MTQEEFKNLKIGETFIVGCKILKVVEKNSDILKFGCNNCYMQKNHWHGTEYWTGTDCWKATEAGFIPECLSTYRKDKTDVLFLEVLEEKK